MDAHRDRTVLDVYVPAPESEVAAKIWQGSGIVGSMVGDGERLRLDFEGNDEVYPTYVDRVERAAQRHNATRPGGGRGYPSKASAYVDPDEVVEVGRWDPVEGELTVTDSDRLTAWLE